MATPTVYSQVTKSKIVYPDSDGEPMAESDFQREPLIYALEALQTYFQNRPDVYVSGDLLIYYEKGNPAAVVAPDVFVVIGVGNHKRTSYKLWEEKKAPDFVLEITSRSTFFKDQGTKRGLYALLGVQEYFQYDPTNDYLQPPLQGVHLVNNNYQPLKPVALPDSSMALASDVLGLELRLEKGNLRFFDPKAEQGLLTHQELEQARQAAEVRIAELETRLQALESASGE